jgi:hypothetical protein
MTYHDLLRKLDDEPLEPFRIKLVNNTAIDVYEPGMVIVGQSRAVVPTQLQRDDRGKRYATDWKTISIAHIIEFSDLNVKEEGKRKRA